MSVNFPSSPILGQTASSGSVIWTFNGTGWVIGVNQGFQGSQGSQGFQGVQGTIPESIELIEEINFNINLIDETNIILDTYAWYEYNIDMVALKTVSDTVNLTFFAGQTAIGGLTSITASSTLATFSSTSNKIVGFGSTFSMTKNSGVAERLLGSIRITRN
jgi:hypothetical protein